MKERFSFVLSIFFLLSCNNEEKAKPFLPSAKHGKPMKIALQPLGKVDSTALHFIKHMIDSTFSIDAILLLPKDLPTMAWYAPRQRYVADSILQFLKTSSSSVNTIVLGITTKDIATQKGSVKNFGIMGLGYRPGRFCVISSFRLQAGLRNQQHLLQRWAKVALHELGHNLGLPHCVNQHCLMVDAEGKNKLDSETDYCINCKKQLISFGYLQP